MYSYGIVRLTAALLSQVNQVDIFAVHVYETLVCFSLTDALVEVIFRLFITVESLRAHAELFRQLFARHEVF